MIPRFNSIRLVQANHQYRSKSSCLAASVLSVYAMVGIHYLDQNGNIWIRDLALENTILISSLTENMVEGEFQGNLRKGNNYTKINNGTFRLNHMSQ